MKYTESASGYSHSVGYDYDDINNLISQVETINGTTHTTSYTYDKDNRVKSKTTDGITVSYTYDALGRITQQITKNGSATILTESYTYTANSSQIATYRTVSSGYDVTYTYTYDDNGNILTVSDGANTTSYVYDSQNQLLRENNQAGGFTHVWVYDNAGNIQSRAEYEYSASTLGAHRYTLDYTYGDSEWGDLLTAYDGDLIWYDALGNRIGDCDWLYTWEHGRELTSIYDANVTWSFTYDANGMRTKRTDGTSTYSYVYNGDKLVRLIVDAQEYFDFYFTYDANGPPLTMTENGMTYYYVTNLQGDVIGIIDSSGEQIVTYTYDAWGKDLTHTNTQLADYNPLRYRGYVYDFETKLYYVSSRYYDPEIGRFINADNNFSNYNLFMYCGNNPVNRIDPNGEHWYYLWIDDLIEAVDELMASVSNIVYGRAAYERSYYDPKGANDLWNTRPFQDTKPSQEMQIFTEFMYDHDFVADISVSVDTPIKNTYVKVGASKVLSPNKNIDASYVHAGIGASTPSVLPINISYSVGIVNGVKAKENYAKHFLDIGAGAIYGFDYCWWPNGASAYSFTIGTSYGVYGGYDYYWCLD